MVPEGRLTPYRRLLAAIFLPLTICGLMLILATTSKQMVNQTRWPLRITGMIMVTPGVLLMLLSIPFRDEIDDLDEERESDDPALPL